MTISQVSMRRYAVAAIAAMWLLVVGGLAWATRLAVHLDHAEARADWKTSFDERRLRALWRMEAVLRDTLAREQARSYEQFRPYYVKRIREIGGNGEEEWRRLSIPSELQVLSRSDRVLLHFQASEAGHSPLTSWKSPQILSDAEIEMPASGIPAAERARATPGNWMSALRERYTPSALLQVMEQTRAVQDALLQRRPEASRETDEDRMASALSEATEFIRRAKRFTDSFPIDQCEPELVALENLDAAPESLTVPRDPSGCVPIVVAPMVPVWLDLTLDDHPQLALVRTVSAEGFTDYCTLQGVLLDWERLRRDLESQIVDLFPGGRVLPVTPRDDLPHEQMTWMMGTLSARLDPGEAATFQPRLTDGLRVGLWTAWIATILALAALTVAVVRYLASAERRIRFVAAVTHELRTPLTTFQLYTDLMADNPGGMDAQQREYVETLRDESKRLSRLVENVLAYARIGRQGPTLRRRLSSPCELMELVRLETLHRCAESGKTLVIEDGCPPGVQLATDGDLVVQILSNLVENACKHGNSAADARIWLSVSASPGSFNFAVEDAGSGVAEAERRVVFQPFRQGSNGRRSTVAAGLGLGLALSRYWARCLGGDLALRRSRRSLHQFSRFELTLPADAGGAPAGPPAAIDAGAARPPRTDAS